VFGRGSETNLSRGWGGEDVGQPAGCRSPRRWLCGL